MVVRSTAHGLGLRFRLHDEKLPGKPDMVLARRKTVIFVNGCYWHRHRRCKKATLPKSNVDFWSEKFRLNVKRDKRNYRKLEAMGWRVIVIWQCEAKSRSDVEDLLRRHFFKTKPTLNRRGF